MKKYIFISILLFSSTYIKLSYAQKLDWCGTAQAMEQEMKLDPEYAKKKVIDYFENTVRSIDYEDQLVFLRTNTKIMSINVKGYSKYYQGEYEHYKVIDKKIKQEVKLLEKLVRKKLESLD